MLSQMYKNLGREAEYREAARKGIKLAERALVAHPDVPLPAALGSRALAKLGESARALEWVSRAMMIAPDDPLTQYNTACAYSVLGEADHALDLLERWTARTSAAARSWIPHDTDFDNIRDHPRFKKAA
jgi:adenylate cyclase